MKSRADVRRAISNHRSTLTRARTAVGLTQAKLARRAGTTQSAVARLEGGRVSPSVETLRNYAAATGRRLRVELV